MPKVRAKNATLRVSKRASQKHGPSREVTADEVVENLMGLFENLGIDLSRPATSDERVNTAKIASHTLYPYASAIGELLASWHQEPKYLNGEGEPARIRLSGPSPSFRDLAQRTVPSVDESYLLSELERLGVVTIEDGSYVLVHMRSFPAYEDKRLAAQHTLTTLDGFISTLRHNLESTPSNSDQFFHRIAWNNAFDIQEIPALKVRVKRHGQSFLEAFDNWMTQNSISKSRKSSRITERVQVSVGVYLSVEQKRPLLKR